MRTGILAVSLAALAVAGCAANSDKIVATYVSPMQYQSYSCRQLSEEAQRVAARAAIAAGVQDSQAIKDSQATKDKAATPAGRIIYWPAVSSTAGNDPNAAAELARLRGELEAIELASIRRDCRIQFRSAPS
jgi:hypothetical protein